MMNGKKDDYPRSVDETVLLADTLGDEIKKLLESRKNDEIKLAILHILQYINGEEVINHDNSNLLNLLPHVLKLQNDKEAVYGRSWCKHGDVSAFFNIERKYDRLNTIMTRAITKGVDNVLNGKESETATETFLDTIVDVGLYGLMWAGFRCEQSPVSFHNFLISNNLI